MWKSPFQILDYLDHVAELVRMTQEIMYMYELKTCRETCGFHFQDNTFMTEAFTLNMLEYGKNT